MARAGSGGGWLGSGLAAGVLAAAALLARRDLRVLVLG